MKTIVLLVSDEIAQTLPSLLPAEQAWILDERYDTFRCHLHAAVESYTEDPSSFQSYHDLIADFDAWLHKELQ